VRGFSAIIFQWFEPALAFHGAGGRSVSGFVILPLVPCSGLSRIVLSTEHCSSRKQVNAHQWSLDSRLRFWLPGFFFSRAWICSASRAQCSHSFFCERFCRQVQSPLAEAATVSRFGLHHRLVFLFHRISVLLPLPRSYFFTVKSLGPTSSGCWC
jgi:hypothetical protein